MSLAIYFDLDGTLISYQEDFRGLFDKALGFQVEDKVYDLYVGELFSNLENLEKDPYIKAFREINEEFDLGINPGEVAEEYISIELDATEVNEKMFGFLKFVSNKHKVGILTNGSTSVQAAKIRKHGISDFIDEAIISNDVGVRKPDKQIFKLAREKLDAEEHVYIGDTLDEDIKPSSDLGFRTVYISGEESSDLQSQDPESFAHLMNLFMKSN